MKKLFSLIAMVAMLAVSITPTMAAKPEGNNAGAVKYDWHLSGSVMPVPPYGSMDIPGSDTASKLIVNQPNGKVTTNLTGVMKGLHPDTTYTVYLSRGYEPYSHQSILGEWTWTVLGTYVHDVNITTQNADGTFSGTAGYPSGHEPYDQAGETTEVITGQIVGNTVTLTTVYNGPYNPGYTATAVGIINADGSISGTSPWSWTTSSGAVKLASGSTGWPGLIPGVVPFTFTTNGEGIGSWHYNFKDIVLEELSVWINEAGRTILISDSISL